MADEWMAVRTALIDVLGEGSTDENWAECAERIVRERNRYRAKYRRLRRLLQRILTMVENT
jgi:hypothetical protein